MDLSRFFWLAFCRFILVVSASSRGLQSESGENASAESMTTVPLDRRTNMFLHAARKVSQSGKEILDLGEAGLGLFDAFFVSLSMIIVSEIGDETFVIAALMAMRHPKSIVLSGALTALVVMTVKSVLSTGLGRIVPNLISRKHTNSAATGALSFNTSNMIAYVSRSMM